MKKRILSFLMCVLLVGTMLGPANATDLEEQDLAAAAIESMGGDINTALSATLTRAAFCNLAVVVSGNTDTVSAASYTNSFSDVLPTHWASEDINLMYTLGYINGMGNGTFDPDRGITVAELVTVCLRMLGYSSSDVGYFWPRDYIAKGSALGLLDDISTTYSDTITYGEGLVVLYRLANLTNTSGKAYLSGVGASTLTDVVVLDNRADNGSDSKALYVLSNGNYYYYSQSTDIGNALVGTCRGTLLLNTQGESIGFVPNDDVRISNTIATVDATSITFTSGLTIAVPSSASVILDEQAYSFGSVYYELERYSEAVICYGGNGTVQMVLPQTAGLLDGYVITGYYDAADPNPTQPETVEVMGTTFDIDDGVSFAGLALGDQICMTLDAYGNVVAVSGYASSIADDMIGVYSKDTVTLTCGVTIDGVESSAYEGQLVRVVDTKSSGTNAYIVSTGSNKGAFDVENGTIGGYTLASDVVLYERIGDTAVEQISISDITVDTVQSSDVTYLHLDSQGQVDILLLDNVTGDLYTYGFFTVGTTSVKSSISSTSYSLYTLAVEHSDGTTPTVEAASYAKYDDQPGGMAWDDDGNLVDAVVLEATEELTVMSFSGTDGLVSDGVYYAISDDVQVYYQNTDTWTTLAQVKTYANAFVGYFDRDPDDGGKIRVIVATD